MKRQKFLFQKDNYIINILKKFMLVGLFIIALLLILVHKIDLGLISGVSKSVFYISSPVIKIITLPSNGISYIYKKSSEIFNVYEENNRLRKQNNELSLLNQKIINLEALNNNLIKLNNHFNLPESTTYTAHIISENSNGYSNSLIIYIETEATKIKSGYAVVNEQGLIGRIEYVSGKYAFVTLITDINSKIPVISQRSRTRGILVGNNTSDMELTLTPLSADFIKNDILLTSGIGGGLPPNIPIAKIKSIKEDSIKAIPLYTVGYLEIVKIISYDVLPDNKKLNGIANDRN